MPMGCKRGRSPCFLKPTAHGCGGSGCSHAGDGWDSSLREIKQRHPLIEVIMLTGHASLEVAIEGMELGAFDYMMKPIEIDELLYKLQDAYKKKSIHTEKIKKMKEATGSGAGGI